MLKAETIGLAVSLELPLLVIDVQRAGPSTGMPTKPEQADLLMTLFGRNSESPVPIVAASSPSQCFHAAIEAARIALKYRTPVYLLSDAALANGSEPWRLPDVDALPDISTTFTTEPNDGDQFLPYLRDPETLARPWAVPGTPGLEHRIGGLEKADMHRLDLLRRRQPRPMVRLRQRKIDGIAADIPRARGRRPRRRRRAARARLGLDLRPHRRGGAAGATAGASRSRGRTSTTSTRSPRNTGDVVRGYPRVLVPEMNLGQLALLSGRATSSTPSRTRRSAVDR